MTHCAPPTYLPVPHPPTHPLGLPAPSLPPCLLLAPVRRAAPGRHDRAPAGGSSTRPGDAGQSADTAKVHGWLRRGRRPRKWLEARQLHWGGGGWIWSWVQATPEERQHGLGCWGRGRSGSAGAGGGVARGASARRGRQAVQPRLALQTAASRASERGAAVQAAGAAAGGARDLDSRSW